MANTINSMDAFKKFSAVRTCLPSDEVNSQNSAPLAGTQMFIQGSSYNFRENDEFGLDKSDANTSDKFQNMKKVPKTGKDKALPGDFVTKAKVSVKKIAKLPEYVYRGFKGDPNVNFYEYLSLGNIPYYVGGAMLTGVFAAGATRFNPQARESAIKKAKQIGVGVGLYYLGSALAQKVIDIPVKIFRGVDLNQPYEDVIDCRAISKTGESPKKKEYHTVTESIDFTRWDLMYGDETKENGKVVNKNFDKIKEKFGIDEDVQDSDSTLKGSIKKLIISSRAFKYALTVPFVVLGAAVANHEAWGNIGNGLENQVKGVFEKGLDLKTRAAKAKDIFAVHIAGPMVASFKSLWGQKGSPNKLGRAIILTAAISPILANLRILQLTSEKDNKFVDVKEYVSGLGLHKKEKTKVS